MPPTSTTHQGQTSARRRGVRDVAGTTLHAASAAATARYYTQYLTAAPGEMPGVWTGRQAAGLGLCRRGRPRTRCRRCWRAVTRSRGHRSATRSSTGSLANGTVVRAVAGFDATFSAPKSLSVWWALTGDDRLLAAHDIAVAAALAHLERYGSTTRIRANGRRLHPDSQGLTVATFRQTTSRADDPQIHTHAVISAKVQTADGRWLALDARYLKRHQRMLGGLYQSVLRDELTHRYGVAWEPIVNGQAEIAGAPAELLAEFSKRAAQVDRGARRPRWPSSATREGRDPTRWERAALDPRGGGRHPQPQDRPRCRRICGHGGRPKPPTLGWTADRRRRRQSTVRAPAATHRPSRATLSIARSSSAVDGRVDVDAGRCPAGDVRRRHGRRRSCRGSSGRPRWSGSAIRSSTGAWNSTRPTPRPARRTSDGRSVWLEPTAAAVHQRPASSPRRSTCSPGRWTPTPTPPAPSATVDVDRPRRAAGRRRRRGRRPRPARAGGRAGRRRQDDACCSAAVDDLERAATEPVFGCRADREGGPCPRTRDRDAVPTPSPSCSTNGHAPTGHPARPYRLAGRHHGDRRRGRDARHRRPRPTRHPRRPAALAARRWSATRTNSKPSAAAACSTSCAPPAAARARHASTASTNPGKPPRPSSCDTATRPPSTPTRPTAASCPARFDEHLDRIARRWLAAAAAGRHDRRHHDDQRPRRRHQPRHPDRTHRRRPTRPGTSVGHRRRRARPRRRRRRHPPQRPPAHHRPTAKPVRNRERWTVRPSTPTARSPCPASADTARSGCQPSTSASTSGSATPPPSTATSPTPSTVGVELVTAATTRRGLYVGATRGRDENLILVVTEHPDLAEARDVLEGVLASDRADTPAVTQRRQLARQAAPTPQPTRPGPVGGAGLVHRAASRHRPRPRPRRRRRGRRAPQATPARGTSRRRQRRAGRRRTRLPALPERGRRRRPRPCTPPGSAMVGRTGPPRQRDPAPPHRTPHPRDADTELTRATATLEQAQAAAAPHAERHAAARRHVEQLRGDLGHHDLFARMNDHTGTVLVPPPPPRRPHRLAPMGSR